MSDEQQAFLNAIHANPDDDLVRLVYADWLDEHGQPERAEFIRVQIELARGVVDAEVRQEMYYREGDLRRAHCAEWAAEVGIEDRDGQTAKYRRGFVFGVSLSNCTLSELEPFTQVPGLRQLHLWRVELTEEALRAIATLDLESLSISETSFPAEWLDLLDPLPCGTVLDIRPKEGPFDRDVWHAFQARRIGRLVSLSPEARYAEARRWKRGHDEESCYDKGSKTISIEKVKGCDLETQLLAELHELEEVRIDECDLTAAGLEHVARLPQLKRLHLSWLPIESITPLARCTGLDYLRVWPEHGCDIGDAGTEGLEQLVNLRELLLRYSYGEQTLARLGSLRKLTSLDIELEDGLSAESFAPLSNLCELEQLKIEEGDIPGGALRFLSQCRKLQKLALTVPAGSAEDFAGFESLTELRELHIKGDAVTDDAIQHLAPLDKLRTLLAHDTFVTPAGAQWLAAQLPEVTVILDEYVAKSPRLAITFRRLAAEYDEPASAMIPAHWFYKGSRPIGVPCGRHIEDGWKDITHCEPGPAEIGFYVRDDADEDDPAIAVNARVEPNGDYRPLVEQRGVVELPGTSESCVFSVGNTRHLVVALANEGKCAVLECDAPQSRFEEFRPLFLFAARSLRVGEAAKQGIGEEVTVAVSDL